jgi:cytoskeletal protein RodZ
VNRIPPLHPDPARSSLLSRRVRVGAALTGVAGVLALAGCSGAADAQTTPAAQATSAATATATPSASASATTGSQAATTTSTYKDGTYTAEGSYATPETVEKISVTVTLQDDVVTDVEVTGDPQASETKQYQSQFIGGISAAVVGKDIDQLSVSRVAGSSLTSGGFNKAIETIKTEAKA